MPIHDQGYRRFAGARTPHGRAWWTIARMHLIGALRRRWFVVVLVAGWVQFLARSVQIYVSSSLPQASFLAATPQTFRDFFDVQSFFVFVIAVSMAGLVADDRRANALQLYLSRPLTRVEYVVGKAVPLLVYLLGVTLVPALLLLLVQVVLVGSTTFLRQNLFLLPAVTLFAVLQALVVTVALLALSSLTKSRRFAAVMYAGAVFFSTAMYQALRSITGSRAWAALSPTEMLDVVADAAFRIRGQPVLPVPVAVAVIVVLMCVCVWVLERRIRAVEVVA